jgi:hypothetical protein
MNVKPFCIKNILAIAFTILLTSCLTLKNNYIESTDRLPSLSRQRPVSKAERRQLNLQACNVLDTISGGKNQGKYLKAAELNQLYSAFGRQLDFDRYYNSILHKEEINYDSLSETQCMVAAYLLNSAAEYNRSYQRNSRVRQILNRGNLGNNIPKHTLQKSNNFLYSLFVRKSVSSCKNITLNAESDSLFNALPQTNLFKAVTHWFYQGNDRMNDLVYDASHAGSYAFGNTVGAFNQKRDQKKNAEMLLPYLKPFDIIVSKSPQHLTDQFIPGYFGHSAIWFGDDISKRRYLHSVKIYNQILAKTARKSMVEALRSGVQVSSLEEFADGEVYAIIRIKDLSNEQKAHMIESARHQIGKPYDFNFDIESSEAITCTELIFLATDFIDWKVRRTFGRFTLSPDDLLDTAIDNELFEIPVFFTKTKIVENPDPAFLRSKLK